MLTGPIESYVDADGLINIQALGTPGVDTGQPTGLLHRSAEPHPHGNQNSWDDQIAAAIYERCRLFWWLRLRYFVNNEWLIPWRREQGADP